MSDNNATSKTVDRTKFVKVTQSRPGVWQVLSMNNAILGAFTTEAKALAFRDSVPLDKIFAA